MEAAASEAHVEAMRDSGVVVLMYHGVGNPADGAEGTRYTVTRLEFTRQLEAMKTTGVTVLGPEELVEGSRGVFLSFDDGEASVAREALPKLAALGLRAALFMTTGWIGKAGYLDERGLLELQSAGWLLGSHGHTHRFLNTLAPGDLSDELRRSRDHLAEILGARPEHLAFPGGRTSARVEATARSLGFTTFWSSLPGINREMAPGRPIRRTAIRRGESIERFRRLVCADPLTHALDEATMRGRGAVRAALGENRYHALTGRMLAAMGRQ